MGIIWRDSPSWRTRCGFMLLHAAVGCALIAQKQPDKGVGLGRADQGGGIGWRRVRPERGARRDRQKRLSTWSSHGRTGSRGVLGGRKGAGWCVCSIQRSEVKSTKCSRNDRREDCWRVQGGVFVVVVEDGCSRRRVGVLADYCLERELKHNSAATSSASEPAGPTSSHLSAPDGP